MKNFGLKKAKELIGNIRELESKKGFKSMDISVRIFSNSYDQELVLLHKMGEFEKSIALIPEIEKQLLKLRGKVSKEMEIQLTYNKAVSYFGVGEFKTSLQYINEVLNDNEQNLRQDIYSFSRLINLLVHYELENYDFLDYVSRRIMNEIEDIARVVYDISGKPPGTIEWE